MIVLNDDHNTFEGVAFALAQTIPGVDYDRGMALATKIHNTGQAIVWSGHQELAELYHAQLDGYGLTLAPLETAEARSPGSAGSSTRSSAAIRARSSR